MTEQNYLDGSYLASNPTWHEDDSAWKAQQILKMIGRNRLAASTVCEVGCGAGEVLVQLQKQLPAGTKLLGYDISPQALALCQKKENENLRFYLGDLLELNTPPFDLVLGIDVVEHIEDCFGFLRRLRAKGSKFIFHFPLDMSAQMVCRQRPMLKLRQSVGHVHYFMKDTALALLADTGYTVMDHFYTGADLDLPVASFKARMAKWPRRALYAASPDLAVRVLGGWSLLILARA